jgi:excisionase family DNA binding protein
MGSAGIHQFPARQKHLADSLPDSPNIFSFPISTLSEIPEQTCGKEAMAKLLSEYEPLLTTAAVAKWLGISTRAVCLWAECNELPAIKIGRQWRFRREELGRWLQSPRADRVKPHSSAVRAVAEV